MLFLFLLLTFQGTVIHEDMTECDVYRVGTHEVNVCKETSR
jgi:hypothetical protein